MSEQKKATDDHKLLKQAISAFVSVTHVIAFFQIVICSRHLAVAFNIPPKNIGIYFAKLYSLRSVLMSMSCGIEYGIYRIIQFTPASGTAINIRRYLSIVWFVLLTICEISFLCVLYFSKSVAFHNYIVLNLEGMFFGFFQMSILSLIPEFAAYYMLSLYVSGSSIFIIQTFIDRCTQNSMLSVKIQAWICVICSVICVGLWPVRLFLLTDQNSGKKAEGSQNQSCTSGTQLQSQPAAAPTTTTSTSTGTTNGAAGEGATTGGGGCVPGAGGSGTPGPAPSPPSLSKMEYVMSLTSITILKIMTSKLTEICSQLSPESVLNVQILITRLQQIRSERDISYEVLVAIDLVILGLRKCSCPSEQLCLLADLSLFLRIKVLVKPEQSQVLESSTNYGQPGLNARISLPPENLLYIYPGTGYPYNYIHTEDTIRAKRSLPENPPPKVARSRTRRNAPNGNGCTEESKTEQPKNGTDKDLLHHLFASLSPLMMFPIGSLVKDFLFPGVIPYGLLERDKCHLINLIVIIFLSVGPVTIFIINEASKLLKENVDPYHWFWLCMLPKIIILIISLCAIHTKQSCTHKVRSSQPIVLFMTVIVLTCYGFLETMSFVGMAFYVKLIAKDPKLSDLQAIHNVSGKFFRYFVYKLSVGYNKTRISAGFTLPNFKPPEPIGDTFCYWFKGTFSNGWKDLKSDFKFNIKQYLEVGPAVSKKSPIETLRYCDIFM